MTFIYLGPRGAGARFAFELAQQALERPDLSASFIISGNNQLPDQFGRLNLPLFQVDTLQGDVSPKLLTNYLTARSQVLDFLKRSHLSAVVNVMPHLWIPLIGGAVQREHIRYMTTWCGTAW